MPEVVDDGKTGILVPPRDHTAMADALIRLLSSAELRARMGAAGLERVRATFSAERMVQDTLEIYRRVAMHAHVEA
jgi:glycosyltransferase involved in cell wall biosynthesis